MLRTKAKFPKTRRKIHRAFYQWYCGIQKQLQLECVEHRDNYLVMQMPGLNSVISFVLTAWEINVAVEWHGQCWDLLIAFDVWPKLAPEGYYCSLCDEDSRVFYPNRIELWRDHLFKPFLDWVNNEYARINHFSFTTINKPPGPVLSMVVMSTMLSFCRFGLIDK